jgi:hypothetical protein
MTAEHQPTVANKRTVKRYVILVAALVVAGAVAVAMAFVIEDRKDRDVAAQLESTEFDLRNIGAQIAGIKDANLRTTNDFIAAYAQVEPLEREYEAKLQRFSELYQHAREKDSHRGLFDPQRWRGRHHPDTWEKVSEIIVLVRQINEITKREISVVHAMALLPEAERAGFWHEQFMPLAAQEHALREQLLVVGQGQGFDRSIQ